MIFLSSSDRLFELFERMAELRKSFLEHVTQQRHAHQILRRPPVMRAGGLGAKIAPIVEVAVAAAEPGQRHKVDLLVFVQAPDYRAQFGPHRIVAMILENRRMASSLALEPESG